MQWECSLAWVSACRGRRKLCHRSSTGQYSGDQHPLRGQMSDGMKGKLKQLAFQLDVAAAWMAPLRVELNTNLLKNGSVLYIGAANRELGLRASAGPGVSFGQAREIWRKGARDDPEFRNKIIDIEGRRVVLHIHPLSRRCAGGGV